MGGTRNETVQPAIRWVRALLVIGIAALLIACLVPGDTASVWAQQDQAVVDPSPEEKRTVDQTEKQDVELEDIGEILFKFLVLAVVFEAALSTIFNWRLFIKHLEGKGWKTVIAVLSAWLIFGLADMNIFKELMETLDPKTEGFFEDETLARWAASFATALLIAGGSDAIFRIYTKLGMRNPTERADKARDERGEGTVEVKVDRAGKATGPLQLSVDGGTAIAMTADHHMIKGLRPGPYHLVVTSTDAGGAALTASSRVVLTPLGNVVSDVTF